MNRRIEPCAAFLIAALLAGCATAPTSTSSAPAAAPPPARVARAPGSPAPAKKPAATPAGIVDVAEQAGLPQSTADKQAMVAHFIDVGQGDATLLEFSCGAVLIDTGGEKSANVSGRNNLVAYLTDFFQRRPDLGFTLNLVVLSHPHVDHTDGVQGLLDMEPAITIRNVVDDAVAKPGDSGFAGQKALEDYASANNQHYFGVKEAAITTVDGLTNGTIDPIDCSAGGGVNPKITALWGGLALDGAWAKDPNNNSVVLRVDFGSASFLFTGDLEEQGIRSMLDAYSDDTSAFDVDVIKVGHHGSKNATTAPLVAVATPRIAVIEVGDPSLSHELYSTFNYGHPNKVAIDLLTGTAGVSMQRPSKKVTVGIRGRNIKTHEPPEFTQITLRKAIYATGWDGNIAITAKSDGTLSVEKGF